MLLVLKEWRFLQLHILGDRTSFTLVSRRGSSEKRESVAQEVAPPHVCGILGQSDPEFSTADLRLASGSSQHSALGWYEKISRDMILNLFL